MLGIKDDYAAYCFDEAITEFGESIEDEIETATEKSKNKKQAIAAATRVLQKRLNMGVEEATTAAKTFADPKITK